MADKKPTSRQDIHEWGLELVDEGEDRRRHWEGQWWENIATYVGDLWCEWDPHRRRLWEPKRPKHRVRMPINLAQPPVRTEIAKLTKNRPITDVEPNGTDQKAMNAAKVGDKVLNNYAERKFHMARKRRRMLNWVTICGFGGLFVDWDDQAEDDIEIFQDQDGETVFDMEIVNKWRQQQIEGVGPDDAEIDLQRGTIARGEFIVKELSPFQLIWDFTQLYIEDAWWIVITDIYDCDEAERRFGKRPQPEDDVEPGVIEQRLLARQDVTSTLVTSPIKTQDVAKVHRLFVKKGHPWFPQGLHMAFTENDLLKKENFPYKKHNILPVALMGHIPLPTSQYSISVLQSVKAPTLEISRTESQMVENRNLVANPIWRIPKSARVDTEIVNKPGFRLVYQHTPNVPAPEPVQMPDLPQYVKDMPQMLKEHILEISGQGETSQGRVPPGARSGVAIAYLQEEDDTRIGPTVQEYEETIERTGDLILMGISEKYDIPRTIRVYRRHGAPEVIDFVGTELEGQSCIVQAGSALPRSKAAKQQFILDLWDRKLEQDPRKVREMLELSSGEPDEWEIDIEQAERENRRMREGDVPDVEEWHNHPAHLWKHYNFMKSPDFEAEDPQTQDGFRTHTDEHKQAQQNQQQEVAMQQAQVAQVGAEPQPPPGPSPNGAAATNGSTPTPADQATAQAPEQTGAEGQNRPEGPSDQYSAQVTPASLVDLQPQ